MEEESYSMDFASHDSSSHPLAPNYSLSASSFHILQSQILTETQFDYSRDEIKTSRTSLAPDKTPPKRMSTLPDQSAQHPLAPKTVSQSEFEPIKEEDLTTQKPSAFMELKEPPKRSATAPAGVNPLAPNPLAPRETTVPKVELTPEEIEVLRVGLFISILLKEFNLRKGYLTKDWRTLLKFWRSELSQMELWRPTDFRSMVNCEDFFVRGFLSVETQTRLYGGKPWFDYESESERERVLEWLQSLSYGDVEYTLWAYYEGGLLQKKENIESKVALNKRAAQLAKAPPKRQKSTGPPRDLGGSVAEAYLGLLRKFKGYLMEKVPALIEFLPYIAERSKIFAEYRSQDIEKTLIAHFSRKEQLKSEEQQRKIISVLRPKSAQPTKRVPKGFVGTADEFVQQKYSELLAIQKTIVLYHKTNGTWSNDPITLSDFWAEKFRTSTPEWRAKYSFDQGYEEASMRAGLTRYFSRDMIAARLLALYKFIYGFNTKKVDNVVTFWKQLLPDDKYRAGLGYRSAVELRQLLQSYLDNRSRQRAESVLVSQTKQTAATNKFKAKYAGVKPTPLEELKKSKSRWTLEHNLIELAKKFPLDAVVRKMIKTEVRNTPHLKYALEYETNDDEDEHMRKSRMRNMSHSTSKKNATASETVGKMRVTFERMKLAENQVFAAERAKAERYRTQKISMGKFILESVQQYLEKRKLGPMSVHSYLSAAYASMKLQFPEAVKQDFPNYNYGSVKKASGASTFEKSYPLSFKLYFFQIVKNYLKTPNGLILLKSLPCHFWAPSSVSRCTIHVSMDCPPNCAYSTYNKPSLRQTFSHVKSSFSWFDRLKPWRRDDMVQAKEKIFMSYSDARECTFEPVVGTKVPKKHLELSKYLHPGISQHFNEDAIPVPQTWVEEFGKNFQRRDALIYKTGVFKQAKILFDAGKFSMFKEKLNEAFNMPFIFNHFKPGSVKDPAKLHEKPLEDIANPASKELLEHIYAMVCSMKEYRRDISKQLQGMNALDKGTIKTFMCPLKDEKCPGDIKPRWPRTDERSFTQLGKNCQFAHHTFELRFEQEQRARKRARASAAAQLKARLTADVKSVTWIPDGAVTDCPTCYVTFVQDKSKADKASMCVCNKCKLSQRLVDKQNGFLQRAKATNAKKTIDPDRHTKAAVYSKKLGLFRKANTLLASGRLVASFNTISKALEIVRQEREAEEAQIEIKRQELRKTLAIEGTMEHSELDELIRTTTERSLASSGTQLNPQKYRLYKERTDNLKEGNANHFLNYQIEQCYLSIEQGITREKYYIERLRTKANEIEDFNEDDADGTRMVSPLLRKKRTQMCAHLKDHTKCPSGANCTFAHSAIQLDLVPSHKVVRNLQDTADALEKRLKNDERERDWLPQRTLPGQPSSPEKQPEFGDLTRDKQLTRNPFE
jgi:hypothetical protein